MAQQAASRAATGDTVYTFAVVPDAIGAVTVDIEADVAEDSGGNGQPGGTESVAGDAL